MNNNVWKVVKINGVEIGSAFRVLPDGRQESCLLNADPYLSWLTEGNEPEIIEL